MVSLWWFAYQLRRNRPHKMIPGKTEQPARFTWPSWSHKLPHRPARKTLSFQHLDKGTWLIWKQVSNIYGSAFWLAGPHVHLWLYAAFTPAFISPLQWPQGAEAASVFLTVLRTKCWDLGCGCLSWPRAASHAWNSLATGDVILCNSFTWLEAGKEKRNMGSGDVTNH